MTVRELFDLVIDYDLGQQQRVIDLRLENNHIVLDVGNDESHARHTEAFTSKRDLLRRLFDCHRASY